MMGSQVRQIIANKITETAEAIHSPLVSLWLNQVDRLPWCVRFKPTERKSSVAGAQLSVPLHLLITAELFDAKSYKEQAAHLPDLAHNIEPSQFIQHAYYEDNTLSVAVEQTQLTGMVLNQIQQQRTGYGFSSILHYLLPTATDQLQACDQPQKIIVEYSSPNIAKPFHAGHLRSTLLGNFISNLHSAVGHSVTRINYLGDWGTQFGLLGVGFDKFGSQKSLSENAIDHLFKVYVKITEAAENDELLKKLGREYFHRIEEGDSKAHGFWQQSRQKSVEEYTKMYKRLGVEFDEYQGESMYHKKSLSLIEHLRKKGLLHIREDGVGYLDLINDKGKPFHVNVLRSDGATLYITRDIVAAIDRKQQYDFDKMLYVVESGQQAHFEGLVHSLRALGHTWAAGPPSSLHVMFGRVQGMSTRRGQVVLLKDILDEAQSRMLNNMKQAQTTKVSQNLEEIADQLATSAIIVQDLKVHRKQNYKFSWEKMLAFKGDTGVYLQYTHCRLCSILMGSDVKVTTDVDMALLTETEAVRLCLHLARYDEVVHAAVVRLEPCLITQYLFTLAHLTHSSCEKLYVRNQPQDIAQARVLLYDSARLVLASGLQLLGITPLEEM